MRVFDSPVQKSNNMIGSNAIYFKREDLLGFSFGGNKSRKASYFCDDIMNVQPDIVITYGSSTSNHCRVIANLAKSLKTKCIIVSPEEKIIDNSNLTIVRLLGAEIVTTPVVEVSSTIKQLIESYKAINKKVYFIPGGGHCKLGTYSYIKAYEEIIKQEVKLGIVFDYIFLASGTGSTQAGLICGQLLNKDSHKKIVGISIARNKQKGVGAIEECISEIFPLTQNVTRSINFNTDYICEGYGSYTEEILCEIRELIFADGVFLDPIYTGKAYWGMKNYLVSNDIVDKNILFIHTGSAPLSIDYLRES